MPVVDHAAALNKILAFLQKGLDSLYAIGHRVVHGGETFYEAALIDDDVINAIQQAIPLAPLHNPTNLAGILTMRRLCPQVPQVAVFDTAFFHTLPPHAYRYALPNKIYRQHHVRRYGFHGTSHCYVSKQAAGYLRCAYDSLRMITLHLGSGASAAAIGKGKCIDTSMGMTPLEGLMMGTRCGDLDPSIPHYLLRNSDMDVEAIETLLNRESGFKGLCGTADMREVRHLADSGDQQASLALEMYCYRICKYIGAYYLALGGLDVLIFTGGIGENDAVIRQSVCKQLSPLGIRLDPDENRKKVSGTLEISSEESKIKVLVIPTNEELEIVNQTTAVIRRAGSAE